jgi:NADPH-dependent F420 reductase
MTDPNLPTIAVIGGTGKEGGGLALRWAHAGYPVLIGSREAQRAATAAEALNQTLGQTVVRGLSNFDAAQAGQIVVLSVPYEAHAATLAAIKAAVPGKIVIDVTAPLDPDNKRRVRQLPGGSAAQEAQQALGANVRVVSAFQNVSYAHLSRLDEAITCDVLVCGNDQAAKQQVIELAQAACLRAYDAGPIENSVVAEGLTAVLININIHFKVKAAGIEITGLPRA